MSEIIKNWLTNCIGVVMNMDPEVFRRDVMDGTIVARILYQYKIIAQEQFISVVPTTNPSVAFKNLKKIGFWLEENDIECCDDDLYEISLQRPSAAVKFFYQLYLALHNKTEIHFLAKKKAKEKLKPKNTRFTVTPVQQTQLPEILDNPLSEPLVLRNDMVQWNQHRYQALMEQYDTMRDKYSKYIREKFGVQYGIKLPNIKKVEIELFDDLNVKFEQCVDLTYEELLEEQKCIEEMEKFEESPKEAKMILNEIKAKRRKEMKDKELSVHQQKLLLMELWDKLLLNQEKEFEETISKKLLKQSIFEKQMVTKMFEVRQQKTNMLQNRTFMDASALQKREEEFLEALFLRNKAQSDEKYNYYFERDRALELHRRLYREKLRLKRERNYNMCYDCMNNLVDIALRNCEFKETYGEEVPKRVQHEWDNLFVKNKPIFDILIPVEDLALNNDDLPEELEEIYRLELDRQNGLDQADFDDYFKLDWPWLISELAPEYEEKLLSIELGMNVLGYNVHQALLAKYPKPPHPTKPDIPPVKISVCINGLEDLSILPVLQKLINYKEMKIIEMQEAINYCLDAYKKEIRTEYIDVNLIAETEKALKDLKKNKTDKGKDLKKGDKGKTNKKVPAESSENVRAFEDKNVQTPIIYPCEEIVLTHQGELGKTAYELLNFGEQLTDSLVVAMFVEYLKSLKKTDIKGWALINYPTNFSQAVLLEEALTGLHIPGVPKEHRLTVTESIGDIADLKYRSSVFDVEIQNAFLRKSKLVPNPVPYRVQPFYDTYLTAYIRAIPMIEDVSKSKEKGKTKEPDTEKVRFNETNEEVEEEEEEPVDPLEKFYADQGCNYAFNYKTLDVATIKHLAKLIVGDYSVPPKASLELFGDTVLYMEEALRAARAKPGKESASKKQGDKKLTVIKEKPPKPEKGSKKDDKAKGAKGAKGKKGDVLIVAVSYEDKETQFPEIEEIEAFEPSPQPRAGEQFWQYTDISFPQNFKVSLGTFWENIEKVYVCDFRELFFIKRIIMNAVIPYLAYVKDHMQTFIARPDQKQTHMYKFQAAYNEIDDDIREDEELKAEVHCRIAEFREILWRMCDNRMREAEQERQRLIQDNWVTVQICELSNNYITAMQLELDRCCDSFQFLIDWYSGVITKMPSENAQLQKVVMQKLESGSTASIGSFGKSATQYTVEFLVDPELELIDSAFHELISDSLNTAIQAVSKWKGAASSAASKMASYFKGKGPSKAPAKGGKGGLPKFTEPDEDVKEAGTRLIEEFNSAINGESLRVNLRLQLITGKCRLDLNDVLNCCKKMFISLYQDIYDRYQKEIESVDTACEVIAQAVEAESQIQPELVLVADKFYINPNVLLFPKPLPTAEPPVKEISRKGIFTIEQLDALTNILMDLAPRGSMPERTFVYLLQDMVVNDAEDGKDPMIPDLWKHLFPNQVSFLSREIFGDVEFVHWKDFIIYNLCVKFPTEDELLQVRQQFRENDPDLTETVKDYQFHNIAFWFENEFSSEEPEEMLRLGLIKDLLLKLFKINEDTVNYTALLLDFCKDVDPIKGFAKALTLIMGKSVCWDKKIGDLYLKTVKEQRYLDDQAESQRQVSREEACKITESVADSLIDRTVHMCDSVVIEDYVSEEEPCFDPIERFEYYSGTCLEGEGDSQLLFYEEANIPIAFQSTYNSVKAYFLPFKVLLTALTAGLPWHARAQTENDHSLRDRVEVLHEKCKNPDFNDIVLAHELLNDCYFVEMLTKNFKFVVRCPYKMVLKLTAENFVDGY